LSSPDKSSTDSGAFPTLVLAIVVAVVIYSLASNPIPPAADCPTGGSIVVGRGLMEPGEVSTHSVTYPIRVYSDQLEDRPDSLQQKREDRAETDQRDQQ
jgi:hypothetical protein